MINIKSKKGVIALAAIGVSIIGIVVTSVAVSKSRNITADISDAEIADYRALIGNSMDVKKSIFILFDTKEEADLFIQEHGADEHPENSGLGAVPYMPDGYYNLVGKTILEDAYDNMKDGEYCDEALEYDGMFCYLKRLGVKTLSDEEIKEMIKSEEELKRKEKVK